MGQNGPAPSTLHYLEIFLHGIVHCMFFLELARQGTNDETYCPAVIDYGADFCGFGE